LEPWIEKVDQIRKQTEILRIYFNNHYGGKAVVNAMQFKEMNGMPQTKEEYWSVHKRTWPEVVDQKCKSSKVLTQEIRQRTLGLMRNFWPRFPFGYR
jgi:hypothetical protein